MSVPPDPLSQQVSAIGRRRGINAIPGKSTLAEELAAEMSQRWRRGEYPPAEEFLDRHPELWNQPEAAADLIYEEMCLRQECGDSDPAEVLRRFPQWRPQLEMLLRFHQALGPAPPAPSFPEAGETIGEFTLLRELGRGARGRVFLAMQPSLASRLVVLKFVPRDGQEHLSLARLQHTHIVPIYSVQEVSGRQLQMLVMPYFGGVTLGQALAALAGKPLEQRRGRDLLEILDLDQKTRGASAPSGGIGRAYLARASYVQAMCWIGAALAEALHFAHEHNLVHLDVKPSNILLADIGQPMLLDFHLAREPIRPEGPAPEWVGGTADYLSPEQDQAMAAVRAGRHAPVSVDGRSDIYSLGLVLYEALGGTSQAPPHNSRARLDGCAIGVSTGLADIVHKCLANAPQDRYARAADLMTDLRRHLSDLPLRGVPNRDLKERWGKLRRRLPHLSRYLALSTAVLLAVAAVLIVSFAHFGSRAAPQSLRSEARMHYENGELDEARAKLERALALAEDLPWNQALLQELNDDLKQVVSKQRHASAGRHLILGKKALDSGNYVSAHDHFCRGQATLKGLTEYLSLDKQLEDQRNLSERVALAHQLHKFMDEVRFLYGAEALPPDETATLDSQCRHFWVKRGTLLTNAGLALPPPLQHKVESDLLDLALLWTDLSLRRAVKDPKPAAVEALKVLGEAEQRFGPSQALCRERQRHALVLGDSESAAQEEKRAADYPPRTEWEHYALGLGFLRAGAADKAAVSLRLAVGLFPQSLWANYYCGKSAYLLEEYEDAVIAFTACVALAVNANQRARCYYNRGLGYSKWNRPEHAMRDYDLALNLDPNLGVASLNRGILHFQQKHYPQAIKDLNTALDKQGIDTGLVYFNLALAHRDAGDSGAALTYAKLAAQYSSQQSTAQELLESLQKLQ